MKQLQPKRCKWPLHLLFRDKCEWLLWSWGWRRNGWAPELYQGATKHKGLNIQSFRTEDQAETFAHQSRWLKERLTNHSTDYHKYRSKEEPFTKIWGYRYSLSSTKSQKNRNAPMLPSGEKAGRAFSRHMQWSLVSPPQGRGDRRAMHSTFPLKCYRWWLGGADTNYTRLWFTMGLILVYVYQPKTAIICHCGILGENGF